jgi:hypothetical protein
MIPFLCQVYASCNDIRLIICCVWNQKMDEVLHLDFDFFLTFRNRESYI